jgi:UDP-N-acetylmuramoylalanine--D-glutamate ligase
MRYLIVGLGKSNSSVVEYLFQKGEKLLGWDDGLASFTPEKKEKLLSYNVDLLMEKPDQLKDICDKIVVSPGIKHHHFILEKAKEENIPITSEIEIASLELNHFTIGITGSNGKTTTTLLIEHMFKTEGRNAYALGNIGTPLLEYLKNKKSGDVLVVELSSYQIDLLHKPFLDVAILLNICPNHLDHYASYEEYQQSKIHLQDLVKTQGQLLISQEIEKNYGTQIKKYKTFDKKDNLNPKLINFLNGLNESDQFLFMSAYSVCKILKLELKTAIQAFKSFKKPSHRIEFVRIVGGISFYNDSKSTNAEATLFAIKQMKTKVVLIAGGEDKGLEYSIWNEELKSKVAKMILIGKCAEKIKKDCPQIPIEIKENLQEAVFCAYKTAQDGEAVLLSPGTSSFDMFKNFEHRGDEFKRIVQTLN